MDDKNPFIEKQRQRTSQLILPLAVLKSMACNTQLDQLSGKNGFISLVVYNCEYKDCGKGFSSEESLDIHSKAHSSEADTRLTFNTSDTNQELFTEHVKLFHKKTNVTKRDSKSTTNRDTDSDTDSNSEPSIFDSKTSLKDHMVSDHSMVPFECEYDSCDQMFTTEEDLREHVSERHTKRTNCQKFFRSGFELNCHRSLQTGRKQLKCEVKGCDYKCNNRNELEAHVNKHKGLKPYKCHIEGCGKQFPIRHALQKHIRLVHSLVRNYVCDHENCNKAFKTGYSLRIHQKEKHYKEGQVYKCPEPGCDRVFNRGSALASHESVHKEASLRCEYPGCEYSAKEVWTLRKHEKTHTTEKLFPCEWPGCEYSAKKVYILRRHQRTHNPEKPFPCEWPGCEFRTKWAFLLKPHALTHTTAGQTNHVCPKCGKGFQTPLLLKTHMKIHSENRKSYVCPHEECGGKRFVEHKSLKNHLTIKHSTNKPYVCVHKDCSEAFATFGRLLWHRRSHPLDAMVKCPVQGCDKEFDNMNTYNSHRHTVHNSRVYTCDWPECDYRCKSSGGYKKHLKQHTG
ncbi:unnamed protein product [Oppiella nova]|uniref:C2H2-type domain-containing protein n=1 Tax=Oppiella nova TaxID=334625 RepID=A0A7R9M651_9ACAR|nr:unnamed protein product [Oppiella nova]CAG2171488.1 unnamed protein product [Oppiella nova]